MNDKPESAQPNTIAERIRAFPFWYHRIALPGGISTPGGAPIKPEVYGIPSDLSGLRVLDVGAWDGYWTFEALKRGAKEVVAVDDFSDDVGMLSSGDRRAWQTFDLCREALGFNTQQCQRYETSVYDITSERFGRFDVVFFFGTLYHLRHPLLALDLLSAVCTRQIFVESAILDNYSPYRGGLNKGYPDEMVAEFYPNKEYGNNLSNWWVPTLLCLAHMVKSSGFENIAMWKLDDAPPTHVSQCRGFVQGGKI